MDTDRRRRDRRVWRPGVRVIVVSLAFSLGFVSGCAGPPASQPRPRIASESQASAVELMTERDRAQLAAISAARAYGDVRDGYRIGPDDLIEVSIPDLVVAAGRSFGSSIQRGRSMPSVAEVPALEQGLRVNSHGDVTLPYLGTVHAEGLTTTELEARLVSQLRAADILRKPQVSVRLVEYRSGVVAVMGSVEHPGLYPITRPGATVADVIWAAGGPSKDAGRLVSFGPDGATDPVRVDLETLLQPRGGAALAFNPRVRRGDVISVAPAGQVLVDGWVEKPGAYAVTRGLTLAGAVAAAGGAQFAADQRHVLVKRTLSPSEQYTFTVDLRATSHGENLDFPLIDGDVVRVPVSVGRVVPWGFWVLAREVVHIGGSVAFF